MPTIPKTGVKLAANSVDILNSIRASASSTYQERIPVATQDNLRAIGAAMMQYQPTQNEFLSALVNRIARVLITSKSYENPLRRFKKGILEYGEAIEEVFVNIARAHEFDPVKAETDVFKREIPNVDAMFHRMNYQNYYKTTISNEQLRQAFLSPQGVSDLIGRIVDQMYTGAEFDEFLIMKNQIVDAANRGAMYPITVPAVTAENAKSIVTTIKGVSNAMEFMSTKYNAMGVLNYTKKANQILIVDAQFDAMIDVEVLASAFNMEKAEFMGQRVLIDDFGSLTGAVAALVDADWWMVFDNFIGFTEIYNGEGLYWNYWYHAWKTFSTSPFANAVLFTTESSTVTGVTVTPATATVAKGQTAFFTASVTGTGLKPSAVHWSVSGTTTPTSTITSSGQLNVATNEPNTTLTVTATSLFNAEASGTATVTVS